MTREEARGNLIYAIRWNDMPKKEALDMSIKALEDIKEIQEVINCDANAEIKCKMISSILTAKPYYFELR